MSHARASTPLAPLVEERGLALSVGPTLRARRGRIAAFDLDGTLITPVPGREFPAAASPDDWMWRYGEETLEVLRGLAETHAIVVMTNQSQYSAEKVRERVNSVRTQLGIALRGSEPSFLVATSRTFYHKPMVGMWDCLATRCAPATIDTATSFYCGHAAGRPLDFSARDALFAANVGVPFHTPECCFAPGTPCLCEKEHRETTKAAPFTPSPEATTTTLQLLDHVRHNAVHWCAREFRVVVLVGFPAAGKSFFAERTGYTVVRPHSQRSRTRALRATEGALRRNKHVVIDCTNLTVAARAPYLALARRLTEEATGGARVHTACVHLANSLGLCRHMDHVRVSTANGARELVPAAMYTNMQRVFEPPTLEEGFDVVHVVSNPAVLASGKMQWLYKMRFTYPCE